MLPVFGLADVPMYLAPFASLVVTSIIIPRWACWGFVGRTYAMLVVAAGWG